MAARSSRETLEAMLDEKLSRREVKDIQSGIKDPDRFDKWVELLQERVDYDEPIVLPCGEGMNVVRGGDGELVIRSDCGHRLLPLGRNWKMRRADIRPRRATSAARDLSRSSPTPSREWMELREFYCPGCGRQLEVEAAPPGYPVMHEFLPDVEGFYRGWLGREVPG